MGLLDQKKTEKLLKRNKIPFCRSGIAKSRDNAVKISKKIGFPVAMKIVSLDISHKSDIGGVIIGVNKEEVLLCYDNIIKNVKKNMPKAKIDGVLIQKMETGKEVIVGVKKDPQFGPMIMFGLGGVFVEILKDVSFRIAPVNKEDALRMMSEVKGYVILKGYRGEKPINVDAVAGIIMRVSNLVLKKKNIVEIDLNPIIANQRYAKVADARIVLE